MPHDRFYIDSPLEDTVILEGEELHHLAHVMRKKEGDEIELVNGKNSLAIGTITAIDKKKAAITLNHVETREPLLPNLTLIQALPKLPLLELVLQKGTELGVSHFYIYSAERSEKKDLSPNQEKRLQTIVIGAMKQCGRLDLPSIQWGFPIIIGPAFFGDLRPGAPTLSSVATLPATLIIGPEKGFSNKETIFLEKIAQGIRITPYTLRTETAAIAGLSILAGSAQA